MDQFKNLPTRPQEASAPTYTQPAPTYPAAPAPAPTNENSADAGLTNLILTNDRIRRDNEAAEVKRKADYDQWVIVNREKIRINNELDAAAQARREQSRLADLQAIERQRQSQALDAAAAAERANQRAYDEAQRNKRY